MRKIADMAWLAGILEGEGAFAVDKGRVRFTLHMTDQDIIMRAAQIIGLPPKRIWAVPPTGSRRKTAYGINVCGNQAASWLLTLYSWFGQRRRTQARQQLDVWKANRTRKMNYVGVR